MLDFNKHETYNQLGLRQTQNIEYKIKHINTNKTYYAVNDSKSKDWNSVYLSINRLRLVHGEP